MKLKNVKSFIENMLQWDTNTTYPKKMNIDFAIYTKKCLFIEINTEKIRVESFVSDGLVWTTSDGKGGSTKITDAITNQILYIDDDAFVNVTKDIAVAITALDICFKPVLPPADDFRGGSRRHCKRNPKKSTKRSKIVKHSSRTMSRRKYKNRK